jgi:caffeoyl-CoA O-methyltransferase
MDLNAYIDSLYGGEDEFLRVIRENAAEQDVPAIQVPFALGQLLQILITASGARNVLEVGTLFGYSAILMGRALPQDGHMLCLEVSAKHADIARRNISDAELAGKIEVRQGDAAQLLPALQGQSFDFIFIDADKPGYPNYLEWAIRLSHVGTLIVADNVWRQGEVTTGADENASAIARFNRLVAENPGLKSVILPTRDGSDAISVSVVQS